MGRRDRELFQNIEIETVAAEGKSLAHVNGKVIFVPFTVPGDIVDIQVKIKRKGYMEGFVTNMIKPSPDRIEPFCSHFGVCGGCKWQSLAYSTQLRFKQQQVTDQLTRIGHLKLPEITPILGSESEQYYRNKLEFTFSSKRWIESLTEAENLPAEQRTGLGFHIAGLFDKVLDINSLLLKIIGLVESIFQTHRIPIVQNLAPELPLILADANQLEQVFLNLVINAQHAMEKEGGVLTVSSAFLPDGKRISISVKDTGTGISSENLSRIFDPFFSTKSEGKGTGLGLSTAYGIVTNHYGEIKVVSAPGEGTEMIVILPVSTPVTKAEKPVARLATECAMPTPALGHRILVVDDEQHIRDILSETLREAGYVVETASNGEEGVLKLRSASFDLILLDIRMPIHSGLDVLKLLRRNGGAPPVMIITGLASSDELDEALRLGAAKCIRKPFHLKTLLSDISGILHSGCPANN